MRVNIISPAGNKQVLRSAQNIAANTRYGIEKSLWQSGKDLIATFSRQVIAKNKTGRLYIRKTRAGARRRHIASAPGESPANRTGFYRKSAGFQVRGPKELIFGNSAEYAGFLEIGTSRMAKRPGLGNAIKATERDIIRNLATGISESL